MAGNDRSYRGKKSYPIPVWNGLLEHKTRIGSTIWVFLWCLDKITSEQNGLGMVHGGAPVKAKQIAADVNESPKTVERHLRRLVRGHYIVARRTPYGLVLSVTNSRKFRIWSAEARKDKTVPSGQKRRDRTVPEIGQECSHREHIIVPNKEDSAVDSAIDTAGSAPFGPAVDLGEQSDSKPPNGAGHSRRNEIFAAVNHLAARKVFPAVKRLVNNPEVARLEAGIYRQHVKGGYFDCIHGGRSHIEAFREAVWQAVLDLTSNRARELRGISAERLRDAAWLKLGPHVETFAEISDYGQCENQVVGAIVRIVAEEALALKSSTPQWLMSTPEAESMRTAVANR